MEWLILSLQRSFTEAFGVEKLCHNFYYPKTSWKLNLSQNLKRYSYIVLASWLSFFSVVPRIWK